MTAAEGRRRVPASSSGPPRFSAGPLDTHPDEVSDGPTSPCSFPTTNEFQECVSVLVTAGALPVITAGVADKKAVFETTAPPLRRPTGGATHNVTNVATSRITLVKDVSPQLEAHVPQQFPRCEGGKSPGMPGGPTSRRCLGTHVPQNTMLYGARL